MDPKVVASLTRDMLDLGCFEVSIADTIGIGSPAVIENVLNALAAASIPFDKLAAHCHDTFNVREAAARTQPVLTLAQTGLANTLTMVNCGIPSVDAAIGGLGGCPVRVHSARCVLTSRSSRPERPGTSRPKTPSLR